jgi:hypothetical protein
MTAAEISQMISTDSFTDAFNSFQRDKIKQLWIAGRVREAQQEAQKILDKPFLKDKTLL